MKISRTAIIYANAMLETSTDCDAVLKNFEEIQTILNNSQDLYQCLTSPSIPLEQKMSLIDEIFKYDKNIVNFLKILTEKNHISIFNQITEAYRNKTDEIKGIKNITIISAIELDSEYKTKVIDKLSKKLNKTIKPVWEVNSEIIGGLIYKIDEDFIIDTSIKNKLDKLIKGRI